MEREPGTFKIVRRRIGKSGRLHSFAWLGIRRPRTLWSYPGSFRAGWTSEGVGGGGGDRPADLLHAMQALSQLS